MADKEVLQEIVTSAVNKYRHRKSNKIRATIEDVINIHFKDIKPLIIKEISKTHFVLSIPPGISFADFLKKKDYFADPLGLAVEIEKNGSSMILKVIEQKLDDTYPFIFDSSDYPKMVLPVPIGHSVTGLIVRDLAKMIFLLVGGTTGGGKSNFIHNITASLAMSQETFVVMIDFKRTEYPYMPKLGAYVTREQEAYNMLVKLNEELDRRLDWLASIEEVKIHDLKNRPPFITLIVDELTEMRDKDSQEMLNRIMRLGRAAGFTGILCTQKPSARTFKGATFTETRSLCNARMCFNVNSREDSTMILNDGSGLDLPEIPGRAYFKHGKQVEVQTMLINPKKVLDLIPKNERVIIFDSSNEQPQKMLAPRQRNSSTNRRKEIPEHGTGRIFDF